MIDLIDIRHVHTPASAPDGLDAWAPVGVDGPTRCGDVGGDRQVSEAYMRRWARLSPDRRSWLVIDVLFYAVSEAEWVDRYRVDRQTIFTICSDLRDPGGTESFADHVYTAGERIEQGVGVDLLLRLACREVDPTTDWAFAWGGGWQVPRSPA